MKNQTSDEPTKTEVALWSLLDDIDTATDLYKPEKTPFLEYMYKKIAERHEHLFSDGYTLAKINPLDPMQNKSAVQDKAEGIEIL